MSANALRCRVCEEVTVAEPVDACRRCDGPTDVLYDWTSIGRSVSRATIAAGPATLWRYASLLPGGAHVDVGAGSTPLRRSDLLSDALGVDLYLKLEGANPTGSYKDRIATLAVSAALDHGVATLCCSSTGNLGDAVGAAAAATGLEAIVLTPAGVGSAAVATRHPGARVFAVDGTYDDCRRLELELGALFPWGFVSGNLHPYASEGAKTISFEIAEQLDWQLPDAVVCPAASGTLFSKLDPGLRGADPRRARRRAAAADVRGPGARVEPDRRRLRRRPRHLARRGVHERRVARRRRPVLRRPRARRSARDRRRDHRRRRGRDPRAHGAARRDDRRRARLRPAAPRSARSSRRHAAATSRPARGSCSSSPAHDRSRTAATARV